MRAEHRWNVRILDPLNCTPRLLRTQPHAAASYRQIPEALPAANTGKDKESRCKRVRHVWAIWRFCAISYHFWKGGAYYVLFWMTVIQHWLRYKCIMLQCFAYLVKLKLKSIPQMLYGIWYDNTGCHSRKGPNFGRVFLMLNYTDITQNTYIQSWMVTEIMAGEKCGHFAFPRSIRLQLYREPLLSVVLWLHAELTLASFTAHKLRPTR